MGYGLSEGSQELSLLQGTMRDQSRQKSKSRGGINGFLQYKSIARWEDRLFPFPLRVKKTRVGGQRLPTTRFVLQMSGDRQRIHDQSLVPVEYAREQKDIGMIMHLHVSEQRKRDFALTWVSCE